MCPIPYLLLKGIDTPDEIAAACGTSMEAAYNVYSNILNRKEKYKLKLFDYEIPLIKHLDSSLLELNSGEREGDEKYEGK